MPALTVVFEDRSRSTARKVGVGESGWTVMPDATAIQSAPVAELTSGSLEELKDLIKHVLAEREALHRAIPETREEIETEMRDQAERERKVREKSF